ncbi:MAG: TetR/AcrR family transcriptional regulator, partial [Clostridium perfringens]|nr:TetR/AcrR family transcriptional regulator [Clostridium perfringens]
RDKEFNVNKVIDEITINILDGIVIK